MRIGVATGLALLFEGDDYIGSAVNLAARLCDAAGPGEVLIPADQTLDLPDGVTATPHGVIELRGFPRAVDGGQPVRHPDGAGPQRHRRALDHGHPSLVLTGRT